MTVLINKPISLQQFAQQKPLPPSLSPAVSRLIELANQFEVRADGVFTPPDYSIEHLSQEDLVQLYQVFVSYNEPANNPPPAFAVLLFDIEDRIFRETLETRGSGETYRQLLGSENLLSLKIKDLLEKGSRFYSLEPKEGGSASSIGQMQIKKTEVQPLDPNRPLKVMKVGFENRRNPAGGVGAVEVGVSAAYKSLRKRMPSCSRAYSLFPLYAKDKVDVRSFTFQGILTHQYNGQIVKSSIYKNKETLEYVVQPDPAFKHVFNYPIKQGVYGCSAQTHADDRVCYLGSAAAAFATLYRGKTGDRNIGIAQFDMILTAGPAFSLLDAVYNPMREELGLERAQKVPIFHDGRLDFFREYFPQGYSRERLLPLGIPEEFYEEDLVHTSFRRADRAIFVSAEAAERALSADPNVHKGLRPLLKAPGKLATIRNGTNVKDYDPTNRESFKELTLERTFSPQGIELTDYVAYRQNLKRILHDKDLIADPKLPLVVFIGRYSPEKGIDVLAEMIRKTPPGKVQFAIMGFGSVKGTVDGKANQDLIAYLQQLSKTTHSGYLRILTELPQQKELLVHNGKNYGVTVSSTIRAAGEFSLMTSHTEAYPLAAVEGQCYGSLFLAPYNRGFKNICNPEGYINPNSGKPYSIANGSANSICYTDHESPEQARSALDQALKLWNNKTREQQNQIARRQRNAATSTYCWYSEEQIDSKLHIGGMVMSYEQMYRDLVVSAPAKQSSIVIKAPQPSPKITPEPLTLWQRVKLIASSIISKVANFFAFLRHRLSAKKTAGPLPIRNKGVRKIDDSQELLKR
jgi:glycosyltransferase involved in cell wall biosynthesis